jgi:hypothetical protein
MVYFEYIGDWSYSIYLYHWPVIRFFYPMFIREGMLHAQFIYICLVFSLTMALALTSYYWVEKTVEKIRVKPVTWYILFVLVSASVGGLAFGMNAIANHNMPPPSMVPVRGVGVYSVEDYELPMLIEHIYHLHAGDPRYTYKYGGVQIDYEGFIFKGSTNKCIALVGDSHAEQWFPVMHKLVEAHNASLFLHIHTKPSVPRPINPYFSPSNFPNNGTTDLIKRTCNNTIVVMAAVTNNYDATNSVEVYHQAIEAWSKYGYLAIVNDVPSWDLDPNRVQDPVACLLTDAPFHSCSKNMTQMVENFETKNLPPDAGPKVAVVNFNDILCPSENGLCYENHHELVVWWDVSHLTSRFVRTLAPLFIERIKTLPFFNAWAA